MFRHFQKNIFTTILNIIGLSVAFTAFIIILVQVRFDLGYNNGIKDSERIYRVEGAFNLSDMSVFSCYLSRPVATMFGNSSSDIESWGDCNNGHDEITIQRTDSENAPFINIELDNIQRGLLDVFSYEIIAGDTTLFHDQKHAIIAESAAKKIFPDDSPLGKVLRDKDKREYTVIAVYKDFPENCCINNGLVVEMGKEMLDDYSEWSTTMFVKLNSPENAGRVEDGLTDAMVQMYKDDEEIMSMFDSEAITKMLRLTPIHDAHFSKDVQYDWMEKGSLSTTYSLLTIAILIILIAIINFVNFSMASIPLTIKNINTRKVLGCTDAVLRMRQITEAVVISLISFGLSLILVYIIGGTSFTSFISASIAISDNSFIIILAAAVAIFTGITAGIYPAIYSTSFSPAMVVKGSFSLSPRGRMLRSALVAMQYVISLVLIIVALFINYQSKYMKGYDMGFRSSNVLTVELSYKFDNEKMHVLTENLKKNPGISDVTFASGMIISNGKMGWGRTFKGEQIRFDCFPVTPNFMEFFGMKITDGRGFVPEDMQKRNGTIIFNEAAIKTYPSITLGDKINGHIDGEPSDFVGIAKNFNFEPLRNKINPIALYVFGSEPWWNLSMCYIKTAPESNLQDNIRFINDTFKEMFPNIGSDEINVQFMDDSIGKLYQKEDSLGTMILIFCGLSVLISIIGILGLIYFETQFKRKEIGVRRVFGSSVANILKMLNLAYIKIASVCFVISIPIAIVIIKSWLKSFTYQATIPVWIFLVAYATILIITILVITLQSYRSAAANPVDSVRNE